MPAMPQIRPRTDRGLGAGTGGVNHCHVYEQTIRSARAVLRAGPPVGPLAGPRSQLHDPRRRATAAAFRSAPHIRPPDQRCGECGLGYCCSAEMVAADPRFLAYTARGWGVQHIELGGKLIELADVIRQLRSELDRARAAAADEALRFELGPIELEVAVALEAVGGVEAKVRFWVIEIGGDVQASSTSTQRLKLTLHPTISDGAGDDQRLSAFVSGREAPGER